MSDESQVTSHKS